MPETIENTANLVYATQSQYVYYFLTLGSQFESNSFLIFHCFCHNRPQANAGWRTILRTLSKSHFSKFPHVIFSFTAKQCHFGRNKLRVSLRETDLVTLLI